MTVAKRLLVVSQSPSLQKLISSALEEAEVELDFIGGLSDILEYADTHQPALIVYDQVNEFREDAARVNLLRAHENLRKVPTIFIGEAPALLYRFQLLRPKDEFVIRYSESKSLAGKIRELISSW